MEADIPVIIGLKATDCLLAGKPSEIPSKDLPRLTDQDLHSAVGEKSMVISWLVNIIMITSTKSKQISANQLHKSFHGICPC